jgi:formate dehydrogenase major subunit
VLRVTIDGRPFASAEPCTILDASNHLGITVPTVCADPRLAPSGACRVCVVAVDGEERPVAACTAPIRDGMEVTTRSPELDALRTTLLGMMARGYRHDSERPEPFDRLLTEYGLAGARAERAPAEEVDASHPTVRLDLSRCISCWRCVRICEEVQGQFTWRIAGRGAEATIVPDSGTSLAESSCVACGACVDTCPTGALEDASVLELGAATSWTRTTCPYCGVGCEMLVGTRDGRISEVRPALDAPVNRGHLCVKGRAAHGFTSSPERVTRPLIRDDGTWRPASWDEAIRAAADGFRRVIERAGPNAVAILGSARATNEENYLVQKLARIVFGTNNVDCCARVCHAPSAVGLREMLGTGAATSSFDDIERAKTILVWGTNTTENHPVVGARIKQAARRGATLVVVDPRRIELADYAKLHLQPRPGSNVLLLNALAHVILEEGFVDLDFARERVDGLDEFRRFVSDYAPEEVAERCDVAAESIRAAARLYAGSGPAISFHGLGVTEHHQGTEGVMGLVNLALLTGNVGKPGTGVNPLRGQNNVQGAAHMGCEPAHLPGYAPLDQARSRVGAIWGAEIPEAPGLDAMEMLDAAEAGDLEALWVIGWDLLLTQPNAAATRRALANLDVLVVQDLFLNETARELATIVLPAASAFEKDGTFMNSERRVQRVRKVVEPPGEARSDAEIVAHVAREMGHGTQFDFDDADAIWDEVRRVWSPGAGISTERLDAPGGVQWPCPTDGHPGTTLLHSEEFAGMGRRTTLRQIEWRADVEERSDEYPLVLVTGRALYQFNAATMTARSATQPLRPTDRLEVSAADASRFGLHDAEPVRVRSHYGDAVLPVEITGRVPEGVVFATFSDPAVSINRVTSPHRDRFTNTPEYKVTAVRLERAAAQ